jgi:hypothetical protein
MHLKRFADAEGVLLDALAKDSSDSDIIANLVVCTSALGKQAKYIGYVPALSYI